MLMQRKINTFLTIIIVAFATIVLSLNVNAQRHKRFSPMRFEAKLEQYITTQAGLTPAEASRFFPVYREMRKKQMVYFMDNRRFRFIDKSDDDKCAEAIRTRDNSDLEVKKIQQHYHNKFLKILPAGKVFKILDAEDRFHRDLFMGGRPPKDKKDQQ